MPTMITVEVCAESPGSAAEAAAAGASRIEFCDNMAEGGTTQTPGNIAAVAAGLTIPVFAIVRPRGGDFVYDAREFEAMRRDIEYCGRCGCAGVVTGVLLPGGEVDVGRSRELAGLARSLGMQATFHRAFDVCRDLSRALEAVIGCGYARILTSGGAATAPEGIETIRSLVEQAAGRISIMPGSGITPENAADIVRRTGCTEIHGTFRSRTASGAWAPGWADFRRWVTDGEKVRKVVQNLSDL